MEGREGKEKGKSSTWVRRKEQEEDEGQIHSSFWVTTKN